MNEAIEQASTPTREWWGKQMLGLIAADRALGLDRIQQEFASVKRLADRTTNLGMSMAEGRDELAETDAEDEEPMGVAVGNEVHYHVSTETPQTAPEPQRTVSTAPKQSKGLRNALLTLAAGTLIGPGAAVIANHLLSDKPQSTQQPAPAESPDYTDTDTITRILPDDQ